MSAIGFPNLWIPPRELVLPGSRLWDKAVAMLAGGKRDSVTGGLCRDPTTGKGQTTECCDDSNDPTTCALPPSGVTTYSISGYTNVYFTIAAPCGCLAQETLEFDGSFTRTSATSSIWHNAQVPILADLIEINGCGINYDFYRPLITYFGGGPGYCWQLYIPAGGTSVPDTVWLGEKVGGGTPAGTYTRSAGCDTRTTVVVV